jgi:HD-GYP domain-containing protein (c-di-GMP phosphodiesterase class II)
VLGTKILAAEIVLHHHEAYNGAGYPSGLAEERIPLGARIFAVADTLDAMTSDRPYRRALPYAMALAEIKRCRGSQFDPAIVDVVLDLPVADLRACAAIPTTMAEEPPSQPSGKLRAGSLAS